MKILVCISKTPDTTAKIAFTDNNTKFDTNGVQWIINPYDEWYSLVRAIELKERDASTVIHLITVGLADAGPGLVAQATGHQNFPEVPLLDPFDGFADGVTGAALGTGLDDLFVFPCCFDQLASFPDIVGNGFFDINIFAGLDAPDRGQGMPMVGGCDGDDVDIFVLKQFADICEGLDRHSFVGQLLFFFPENRIVHIAQSRQATAFLFAKAGNMGLAAAAKTDYSNAHIIVGAADLSPGTSRPGDCGGTGESRGFEEGTTIQIFHRLEWVLDGGRAGII